MKPNDSGNHCTRIVRDVLREGRVVLQSSGIESYNLDAGLILSHVTGLTKTELFTKDTMTLTEEEQARYGDLLAKRVVGMPLPYMTLHVEFMGLDFYVDQNVLIPRGDTEILTEAVIEAVKGRGAVKVLDMCTGSGCIGVTVARYCPDAWVWAVDSMPAALVAAEKNAERHGVGSRVKLVRSDMFDELDETGFDVLVSNPPYIRRGEISVLERNVKDYEPLTALDGGPDGLDFYRIIAANCKRFLVPGGKVFLEIGFDQAEAVAGMLEPDAAGGIEIRKDLAGRGRVVVAVIE